MDRGVREREQALKAKRIVTQTKSRRRQCQLSRTIDSTGVTPEETSLVEHLYGATSPARSIFNHEGGIAQSNSRVSDTSVSVDNVVIGSDSGLSESSGGVSVWTPVNLYEPDDRAPIKGSGDRGEFETNMESLVSLLELAPGTIHNNNYPPINSAPISSATTHQMFSPANIKEPVSDGHEEDILFMYYLDEVFYFQYPFYHSIHRQSRGWLFSILKNTKSAYYAVLALGEYHRQSTLPLQPGNHGNTSLRGDRTYYGLALQEIQCSLARSHTGSNGISVKRTVEALTCLLQLLFWEVW